VRHTGLDVTVPSSDGKCTAAHLSRQGSPLLRWALFEAAQCSARPSSPDYAYYRRVADRLGGHQAALSVARKMVRRTHHTLRATPTSPPASGARNAGGLNLRRCQRARHS